MYIFHLITHVLLTLCIAVPITHAQLNFSKTCHDVPYAGNMTLYLNNTGFELVQKMSGNAFELLQFVKFVTPQNIWEQSVEKLVLDLLGVAGLPKDTNDIDRWIQMTNDLSCKWHYPLRLRRRIC